MTTVRTVLAVLLSVSLMWAQSSPSEQSSSTNALKDLASEVEFLRKALAETQTQVAAQQREIEALKNVSKAVAPTQNGQVSGPAVQANPGPQSSSASSTASSETSFKIGSPLFTPGGFLDLENIYRTTNTQSNIATNFVAIPFNNTSQGNISVNGHTNRLRLFFANARRANSDPDLLERPHVCSVVSGERSLCRHGLVNVGSFITAKIRFDVCGHIMLAEFARNQQTEPGKLRGGAKLELGKNIREKSTAVLRTVFVPDSRTVVRGSGATQERALEHGFRRFALYLAVNVRHSGARGSSSVSAEPEAAMIIALRAFVRAGVNAGAVDL
jgi:hypothetical protein